jgi:ketosteroid isomerase-like protein
LRACVPTGGTALEPEEYIAAGENILVLVVLPGVAKQSRAPVSAQVAHFWIVEDGRVRRLEVYLDRAEGVPAAGVAE